MNLLARLRGYRWRKRVEWFAEAAYRARRQRDSAFGQLKRHQGDLVRVGYDWEVTLEPSGLRNLNVLRVGWIPRESTGA